MIIFNREQKEVRIPKGLGNLQVNVVGGGGAVTQEELAALVSRLAALENRVRSLEQGNVNQ